MIVNMYSYSNSLISRMFEVLDLTKNATSDKEFEDIGRFVGGLIVEIEGSLRYYEDVKFGNQMKIVLMKMNGVKEVTDYNVRRKAILDSIEIVDKIKNTISKES